MAATRTYTWHDDITINGQPYPTRHPVPNHGPNSNAYLGDLSDTGRRHLRAIHEAAHAVAGLTRGAHIHYAKIIPTVISDTATPTATGTPNGATCGCNLPDGESFALFLGAGERAENHWLHQNLLWTPLRAAGIELGAYGDRQTLLQANPHIRFGIDHNDYRVVHHLADQLITQQWTAIVTVAETLDARLHLTGDQIADLAQIPNGTPSTTCNPAA